MSTPTSTLDIERKQYADQRIPQTKLIPWMRQLCDVLIYLHEQNPPIIHRDLKPGNLLIDENERIMLIDFGIAKEAEGQAMTRTLGRAATLHFSPPEQVMGTGTDERADIYALGATFYALLTGQAPLAAHERVAGKELTPPSQIMPDVFPEVEQAILQALELNMNHRQQTAKEFAQALKGLIPNETPGVWSEEKSQSAFVTSPSKPLPHSRSIDTRLKTLSASHTQLESPPARQSKTLLPLTAAALLILAGLGGYLYRSKPETAKSGVPAAATPPQALMAEPSPSQPPAQPTASRSDAEIPPPPQEEIQPKPKPKPVRTHPSQQMSLSDYQRMLNNEVIRGRTKNLTTDNP